ncbi:hypothetical protein UFOVP840_43 [uncultured Caudovirales phage]|uniref:Uncharacterized protein n=1 Tax=uncultured Caudovirales phage TaxID=2100421 RepID=A0A6J5P3Y9_9CAUD|nr:hypothetical protein UFOVP840_43 [uncultured Caudovirales phage]
MGLKFPIDKQAHFWWGWAIAATCVPLGNALFAAAVAALFGAAKEIWDKRGHGTPDVYDFVATAAGGGIGAVLTAAFTL